MAVLIQRAMSWVRGAGCRLAGSARRWPQTIASGTRAGRIALALAILSAVPKFVCAQAGALTEYEVKAAFVYNFAKFVEWPQESFSSAVGPVRICVFGNDPLDSELQRLVSGKTIGTRPIQVERVDLGQVKQCHVLFIGSSESGRLQQVLEAARGATVLTIGDSAGFVDQGGIINFVFDQNRIRFEINLKAAQEARLKLSSKLLSLAKSVQM